MRTCPPFPYMSNIFFAQLMLLRSSIVITIMIIEVLYRAKLPPSFVDTRPRDVIDGISSLASSKAWLTTYMGYVKTINRRCVYLSSPISSRNRSFYNGQSIVAAQLDVIGGTPEDGSKYRRRDQVGKGAGHIAHA